MATLRNDTVVRSADGQGTSAIVTATNIGTYGVAANSTYYVGTTQNVFNRASGAQTLTGVSIDGNAATVSYPFNSSAIDLNGTGTTNQFSAFNVYYPSGGSYNQPLAGSQHFKILQFGRYNADDPNYWRGQMAMSFYTDRMFFRKEYLSTWGSWMEFLHTGNYAGYSAFTTSLTSTIDARAPIFYDSNDTTYYLDPANTGTSLLVAGSVGISKTSIRSGSILDVNGYGCFGASAYGFYIGTDATGAFLDAGSQLIRMFAGSSEKVRIDASGNLGVGITSLVHKIQAVGLISAGDATYNNNSTFIGAILNNDQANPGLDLRRWNGGAAGTNNHGATYIATNSAGDTLFYNGLIAANTRATNEKMRISVAGNVGIGTASPSYKLQVTGQTFLSNGTSNALTIQTTVADGNTRDGIYLYENDSQASGRQAISWYNGNVSYYKARLWTQVGAGYDATVFGIDVANDARTVDTRLAIRNGNIGIGTTSPSQKLHVVGIGYSDTDFRAPIFYDSDNTTYYVNAASTSNLVGLTVANTITGSVSGNAGTATILQTARTIGGVSFNGSAAINLPGVNTAGNQNTSGTSSNITAYTINENVGTANTPSFAGIVSSAVTGYAYLQVVDVNNFWITPGNVNWGLYFETIAGGLLGGSGDSNRLGFVGAGAARFYVDLNNGNGWFGGSLTANTDSRAPIFYDSNDTTYYLDPANSGTSLLVAGKVGIGTTSPGAPLEVSGASGDGVPTFKITSTSAPSTFNYAGTMFNSSLGASKSYSLMIGKSAASKNSGYIGYNHSGTDGSNTNFLTFGHFQSDYLLNILGNGNVGIGTTSPSQKLHVVGTAYSDTDFRAPIFYDSNDTTYYVDPNSNSILLDVEARGGINLRRDLSAATGISFYNTSYYNWQVYMAAAAATGCGANGNLTAPNGLTNVSSWALRSRMEAVGSYGWLWEVGSGGAGGGGATATSVMELDTGGILTLSGQVRVPIFYDRDNTAYYVDPASTSVLNTIRLTGKLTNNGSVSDDDGFGVYWDSGESTAYAIYREAGSWTDPFPDLRIAFHTGIKLGANASYNGIRFYNDYDMTTQVMSVNNSGNGLGANNVYVNNSLQADSSLRAPIFYDSNNTAYYLDPANTGTSLLVAGNVGIGTTDFSYTINDNSRVVGSNTNNRLFVSGSIQLLGNNDAIVFGRATSTFLTDEELGFGWGGGWYMTDETYLRVRNNKVLYTTGEIWGSIFKDSNDTAYYLNPASTSNLNALTVAGGNATIYRDLIVNGGGSGNFGNRIIVQGTATTYTYQDTTLRPTVYLNGAYPVVTLNATESTNTLHGPTLQFAFNGLTTGGATSRQIVIGTPGTGSWLDFGFSGGANGDNSTYNPHNGIGGYNGVTAMRLFSNGLLLGSTGAYPSAITSTSFALDVRGTGSSNTDFRAPIFYDSNNTAYYLDPAAGTSLRIAGAIVGDHAAWTGEQNKIQWHSSHLYFQNTSDGYFIFRKSNGAEPFQLRIAEEAGYATGSWRAPIFYDSNNTAYYTDPASTSNLLGLTVTNTITGSITGNAGGSSTSCSGNAASATYANEIGTYFLGTATVNVNNTKTAVYRNENGLGSNLAYSPVLHVSASDTMWQVQGTYGSSGNGTFYFRQGYQGVFGNWLTMLSSANYNSYAPTLTGTGASGTWSINVTGNAGGSSASCTGNSATTTLATKATRANGNFYIDDNYGNTVVGVYSASRYQGVFAMGDSYKLAADGSTTGSLYGIAWSHPNAGGAAGNLSTHGALILENGSYVAAISSSIRCTADMRTPIYYDSNDTAYYVNPNSETRLYKASIYAGNEASNTGANGSTEGLILRGNYNSNTWAKKFHNYDNGSGIQLYLAETVGTGAWSTLQGWGTGLGYTSRVFGSFAADSALYSPIFYDTGNTAYYCDPAGSSNFSIVTAADFYTAGWFRNNTSGHGIYNQATAQHFYSDDVSYWNVASSSSAQGIRLRTGGHAGTVRGYFYADTANDVGLLNQSGNWRVRVVGGDYVLFDGSSIRAQIFYDSNDTGYYTDPAGTSILNVVRANSYVQKSASQSLSGTVGCTIDVAAAGIHVLTLAASTTISSFTYNNRTANPSVNTIMLVIKYGGTASITWTNVLWANGVTPTTTGVSGYADVYMLTSYQGTTGVWIGTVVAQGLVSTSL
jgi:hypothetical protein